MSGLGHHRSRYVAVGLLSTGLLSIGSALAWADAEDITLDFVRHGETYDNAQGIIDTQPPGSELDPTGITQAQYLANPDNPQQLDMPSSYAGIYASEEIRTLETAQDWLTAAGAPDTPVQTLSGLNEIPAGIFNGYPDDSLQGILYILSPIAWTLGLDFVPELGDPSVNGITFDESFGGAVQTIYDNTVTLAASNPNDVAFSSEGAIAVWTLMNVNNPDFAVVLKQVIETGQFLPNTGQVVVEGSPGDWTLVSYDGTAVPQNPGLPTELFVDFRNLIEAPQFAGYNIYEALLSGNSTTIETALQTGIHQVDTALAQFPVAVFDDILGALTGGTPGLSTDLSTLATDVAGVLPGDLGALVGEAFAGL
jgi:Histidine phosphatase superfamily (branch 1)